MRAPWKRAAILALATCGISILPGCKTDVDKADESVSNEIINAANTTPEKAVAALSAAAGKGSPLTKVQANLALAQAEVRAGREKLEGVWVDPTTKVGVWPQQAKIALLLLDMERLGSQIASNNGAISGFQGLNPNAAQQAFEQVSSAAEKGDGGWVKGAEGGAAIPSMADVKKQQETLGGQIADLTKQRTELAAKRATALQQSETFSRQSDSTTGTASTAAYVQASNLRKEAGDDEVKMHDLDAQILPLQQQLDVANEQQKLIEGTLTSVKDQVAKLQSGWQSVQKQMDALKAFSSSLVNGGGAGAADAVSATSQPATSQPAVMTLNQLAASINEQVKSTSDLRDQAIKLLDDALKHIKDAEAAAATALKSVPKPNGPDKIPEKQAWQALYDLNDPSEFKLRRAEVLGMLARVYASQYIELAQRNAVAKLLDTGLKQAGVDSQAVAALGNGGAPSPAVREAVDKVAKAINEGSFTGYEEQASEVESMGGPQATPSDLEAVAALKGDFYYSWADYILNTEVLGGSPGMGDLGQVRTASAHLARMTNQYGWSKLGELQGKTDAAKGRLSTAITERKALADGQYKGLMPATLPPELAEVATSQPAGQPGEATSQPAPGTEPTTAPSPGAVAADTPEQAAVRTAALAVYDAIMAGDADKARPMVVEERIEYRTLAAFMKAYSDFQKAATEKYPDEAKSLVLPVPDMRQKIQTAKIDINGDNATLSSPGDTDPQKAKRVGGVWKLDFAPGADANKTAQQLQMLNLMGGVFSRMAIGIQNNKYKTFDEMKAAMAQDLKMSIPGFVLPESAPAQPPATAPAGQ